jgi:hypothetical protein
MRRVMTIARLVLGALLMLGVGACSPRIDRLDIYSGSSTAPPQPASPPRAGDPVTIRAEISPRQTSIQTPTVRLQRLWAVAPISAADAKGDTPADVAPPMPMTRVADGATSFVVTLPPGGTPALSYGSTWLLHLSIPYRSLGLSSTLFERRQFTVRAPASCAAFDDGVEGWSIQDDRISYGATLDDIRRWPQDTQTRFLTRVTLEPDRQVNYPETFEAGDAPFGAARFRVGGDQPEKFREWLVRNPYISDKNHWIAQIKTPPLPAESFSVQVMSEAQQPLRLRARAYCGTPGADSAACTPDHVDSDEVVLEPGPKWRTVRLPISNKGLPPGGVVRIGHLLVFGEPSDADRRVWIDMVCP